MNLKKLVFFNNKQNLKPQIGIFSDYSLLGNLEILFLARKIKNLAFILRAYLGSKFYIPVNIDAYLF